MKCPAKGRARGDHGQVAIEQQEGRLGGGDHRQGEIMRRVRVQWRLGGHDLALPDKPEARESKTVPGMEMQRSCRCAGCARQASDGLERVRLLKMDVAPISV
jgi:hypothetical protein